MSDARPRPTARTGFTLVEILIVVVILGILSAMVVPQFASATQDATRTATYDQIQSIRRALAVYYVRNNNAYPAISAGAGTWGQLVGETSGYMREAPKNKWVGGPNADIIIIASTPDTAWQQTHGWIYDPATGRVWAGGFDALDEALPH